jgi:hypothetical protein
MSSRWTDLETELAGIRAATRNLDSDPFKPCRLCGATEAHPDSVNGLCGQCETDMQADRVEMERDDARCCTHYPACGGPMVRR